MEEILVQPSIPVAPQNPIQEPTLPVTQTPPPVEPKPVKKPFLSKAVIAVFIIVITLILLPAGAYLFLNSNKQVACTLEAKICPDGSSVGRTGPKCEFQACPIVKPTPTPDTTVNWKTYTNTAYNFSFKYPSDWTVKENPSAQENNPFFVDAISSKGLLLDFGTDINGVGGKCDDNPNNDLGSEKIVFMNLNLNIFYYGDKSSNSVSSAYLLDSGPCPNIAFFDVPNVGKLYSDGRSGLESLVINYKNNSSVNFETFKSSQDFQTAKQILSTFKFTDQTSPSVTCKPRPACLDAIPRCMIAETSDMCPPAKK